MNSGRIVIWLAPLVLCGCLAGSAPGGSDEPILTGLDVVPPADEGFSPEAIKKWFEIAVRSGMSALHMAPKWDEMEKSPGKFTFGDFDRDIGLAAAHRIPVYLNFRIVDTNNLSIPEAYKKWKFDDPLLSEALKNWIRALAARARPRVRWVSIGNEVDAYLSSRPSEVPAYRKLLDNVNETVRAEFPGAQVTVNFTFSGLKDLAGKYRSIVDFCDFLSLTYYPLNPDFTVRPPEVAREDINRMVAAAGKKRIHFQEIGYPSSELLNSSEEKQQRFYTNVFQTLQEHRGKVVRAHFLWLSDLPDSLVEQFGEYYKLPGSDKFKAYLATLGLHDKSGKPKLAWHVYRREAPSLAARPKERSGE